MVEGKGKSQSNGSKDAKSHRDRDHSYDATTNRRQGHDRSHALVLCTSVQGVARGEDLSFSRPPQDQVFFDRFPLDLSNLDRRGSRVCLGQPCDLIECLNVLQQEDLKLALVEEVQGA